MVSYNNTRVMVTMPKELRDKLSVIADNDGRSLSNLIVQILKIYVNQQDKPEHPCPHS